MMKLLGAKRVFLLAVLLGINVAIAGIFMMWLEPMRAESESTLSRITGEIAGLTRDINNIKQELADFKENLPKYNELSSRGFFLPQDRFQVKRDLERVRGLSKIAGFSFTVDPLLEIYNTQTDENNVRLVNSVIKVDKFMMTFDRDFYQFTEDMIDTFPAHLRLSSFSLRKSKPLNEDVLRNITLGEDPGILQANAVFEWSTLVPKPEPVADDQGGFR